MFKRSLENLAAVFTLWRGTVLSSVFFERLVRRETGVTDRTFKRSGV